MKRQRKGINNRNKYELREVNIKICLFLVMCSHFLFNVTWSICPFLLKLVLMTFFFLQLELRQLYFPSSQKVDSTRSPFHDLLESYSNQLHYSGSSREWFLSSEDGRVTLPYTRKSRKE